MNEPVKLTVSGILQDLQDGYTRTKDDKQYQGDGKSIQEKYKLNKTDIARLFQHEKLKGRKTIVLKKPNFILEDDTIKVSKTETVKATVVVEDTIDDVEEVSADASTDSMEEDPSWLTEDTNS